MLFIINWWVRSSCEHDFSRSPLFAPRVLPICEGVSPFLVKCLSARGATFFNGVTRKYWEFFLMDMYWHLIRDVSHSNFKSNHSNRETTNRPLERVSDADLQIGCRKGGFHPTSHSRRWSSLGCREVGNCTSSPLLPACTFAGTPASMYGNNLIVNFVSEWNGTLIRPTNNIGCLRCCWCQWFQNYDKKKLTTKLSQGKKIKLVEVRHQQKFRENIWFQNVSICEGAFNHLHSLTTFGHMIERNSPPSRRRWGWS